MRGLPTVSTSLSMTCLRRGQIGIAHAEIDDVGAGGAGLGLELVDLLEDVRRQAPHPVKVAHRSKWPLDRFPFRRPCAGARSVSIGTLSAANGRRYDVIVGRLGQSAAAFFSPLPVQRSPWRPAGSACRSASACFWTASRSPLSALRSVSFNAGRAGSGGG